jgi:acyl dehydratase
MGKHVIEPDAGSDRVWCARYRVTREGILRYCEAIGETHPPCVDPAAAVAAGFRDLVAPPMFAAVYALPAVDRLQRDPAAGIDVARVVHGAQTFTWPAGAPVLADDEITTAARLRRVWPKGHLTFFEFTTESTREDGVTVALGDWTAIVRQA